MKNGMRTFILILVLLGAKPATAAPFQNLAFESVILPLVPDPTDPAMRVPIANALPSWHGYLAGIEQTSVFCCGHTTAGSPSLNLLSIDFRDPVLQGHYSVGLGSSAMSDVSISQTGFIPGDAQFIRFLGSVSYVGPPMPLEEHFGLYINGQRLTVTDEFSEPGVYNYSADISAFAGQDVTLAFTSFHLSQYPIGLSLDSISFSPVPEPSTLALVGVAAILGWLFWQRKGR